MFDEVGACQLRSTAKSIFAAWVPDRLRRVKKLLADSKKHVHR